jgi:hypothetical protein
MSNAAVHLNAFGKFCGGSIFLFWGFFAPFFLPPIFSQIIATSYL